MTQTDRSSTYSPVRRGIVAAILDVVLVLAFVVVGRSSHAEDAALLGILTTAWPFLVGLLAGWLISRAWRAPLIVRRTGIVVWLSTVVVGLLLRAFSDQGVQLSFAIVTTIVLGVFFLGWRAIAAVIAGRKRARY
ncbi:MAG: rane protein [Glaciihabitans sp.]|nr:rane protein [Glaciihabitans sp.]